jgi:hypothetical protein
VVAEALGRLRRAPRCCEPEFDVANDAAAQNLGQFREDRKAQVEKLLLPDRVLHFHDQGIAHQRLCGRMRGDALANGGEPGRASQIFIRDGVGQPQFGERFPSAFHADRIQF